jgi:membrane associated rhomboid family serine protease
METLMLSPVALFILALTIVTSLIAWQYEDLFRLFALNPWSLVRERRFYTLLTSGLIHADGGHLVFNMLSFYFFALTLERWIGHGQFFTLYFASMVLSNISTVVRNRNNRDYFCLGASGAVTAVIFSFILYAPASTIYLFFIPIPAPLFAVLFVAYSYYSARYRQTRVNHAAHLWGAVSGIVLTLILDPAAWHIFLDQLHRT